MYSYGGLPPNTVAVIVPSEPPLQLTLSIKAIDAVKGEGPSTSIAGKAFSKKGKPSEESLTSKIYLPAQTSVRTNESIPIGSVSPV